MAGTGWLYDLLTWCVRESAEDVQNWVSWSKGTGRGVSNDQLAARVVNQQSQLAARTPVTPAAVGSLPGVRQAISAGLITADVGFLVYRMIKSVLYQAAAYRHDFKDRELPERVLLILGVAFGHEKTRQVLVAEGRQRPSRVIGKILHGGAAEYAAMLAEEVQRRFQGRESITNMPIVGRPFFGAQNFIFISAAAMAGRYVFNDDVLSQEELQELDHRLLALARSVIGLMMWTARADGHFDECEDDVIRLMEKSLWMPRMGHTELVKDMPETPDWTAVRAQFKTDDEKAGLLENILMVVWADGEKDASEDRVCRRVAAELVADRMIDDIETAVRQSLADLTT